uniref:Uncharacterized protein n=1 Tax=Acrobeloides nanus TaxID=290746 RepID=A0A914DE22_9BILA
MTIRVLKDQSCRKKLYMLHPILRITRLRDGYPIMSSQNRVPDLETGTHDRVPDYESTKIAGGTQDRVPDPESATIQSQSENVINIIS